jgi:hypothetical protein
MYILISYVSTFICLVYFLLAQCPCALRGEMDILDKYLTLFVMKEYTYIATNKIPWLVRLIMRANILSQSP